ncbi:MAG: hypothetical protein KatS3mg111_3641 [Pirellulaceae bacterium]|nr:MAG: hypothetical protein KatS3mg111_3641 [Pirellulaceae bacterium]
MALSRTGFALCMRCGTTLVLILLLPGCQHRSEVSDHRAASATPKIATDESGQNVTLRDGRHHQSGGPPATQAVPEDPQTSSVRIADSSPFVDQAEELGVRFRFHCGREADEYAIIESLGGGAAILDFDGDGWEDAFFPGGGSLAEQRITPKSSGLFKNVAGQHFVDIAPLANVASSPLYLHGAYAADVDNDGLPDLAVSGYGGVQLYRNQGDGTFLPFLMLQGQVTPDWCTGLAWLDSDADGDLDLYVTRYVDWSWDHHPRCIATDGRSPEVCPPREFSPLPDSLFINDGAGQFTELGPEIGLRSDGKGLGVVAFDANADGRLDLYVANDTTDNFLYVQQPDGTFAESAVISGVAGDEFGVSTGSMGIAIFDANLDRLPDLLVTNFERELPALYRNQGNGLFLHASRSMGLAALEAIYVGFGCAPVDFDFDGDPDAILANGHVSYHSIHAPYRQTLLLLENLDGQRFQRFPASGYFSRPLTGRGVAISDVNGDGSEDIVVTHQDDPIAILVRTQRPSVPWASVRLIGVASNRDAIGCVVTTHFPEEISRRSWVVGGGSYLSSSSRSLTVYWPPGANGPATIEVQWPSGRGEIFVVNAFATHVLIEGKGGATDPVQRE